MSGAQFVIVLIDYDTKKLINTIECSHNPFYLNQVFQRSSVIDLVPKEDPELSNQMYRVMNIDMQYQYKLDKWDNKDCSRISNKFTYTIKIKKEN